MTIPFGPELQRAALEWSRIVRNRLRWAAQGIEHFGALGGWISSSLVRLGDLRLGFRPADDASL